MSNLLKVVSLLFVMGCASAPGPRPEAFGFLTIDNFSGAVVRIWGQEGGGPYRVARVYPGRECLRRRNLTVSGLIRIGIQHQSAPIVWTPYAPDNAEAGFYLAINQPNMARFDVLGFVPSPPCLR